MKMEFSILIFLFTNFSFSQYVYYQTNQKANNNANNNYNYNTHSSSNYNSNYNSQITTSPIVSTNNFIQDNCYFKNSNDGNYFDLRNMRSSLDYKFTMNYYTFKANFCGGLVEKCNNSEAPAAFFHSYTMCLGALTTTWSDISADYIDSEIPNNGLKLIFKNTGTACTGNNNTNNSLIYTIKCDQNIDTVIESVRKINNCSYDIVFVSKYGCPSSNIFSKYFKPITYLYYIFIIFFIYITLFTYINFKRNPEDGLIKSFPHRDFWRNFFTYSVEGFKVSASFFKKKFIQNNE